MTRFRPAPQVGTLAGSACTAHPGRSRPGELTGTRPRIPTAVRVLVAALVVAGCGSGGQGSPEPTAGSSTAAAPTPATSESAVAVDPVAAEQAVLEAYRGMWQAYQQAGQPPAADPDHPGLQRYAAGDALGVLADGLTGYREDGLVFTGEVVLSPEVTDLSPANEPVEATVQDCADSSGSQVVRADGRPYEDEPGGRRLITADVEDVGEGTWKVTSFAVGPVGSC